MIKIYPHNKWRDEEDPKVLGKELAEKHLQILKEALLEWREENAVKLGIIKRLSEIELDELYVEGLGLSCAAQINQVKLGNKIMLAVNELRAWHRSFPSG